ncbi:hypothetical protein VNI00_003235 [Paramarasmius palmivorus]|uniref:CTLH/CRA C-terminal to LisH motif domain-containing protein n=1 Tax=Paramarasmius palmivorus TaxID=297713 RepID=A0AAW0DSW7_9AGAR
MQHSSPHQLASGVTSSGSLVIRITNEARMQRELVLDYLTHSGYIQSAQAFLRDSAVRHIDVDGDEIMDSNSGLGGSGVPEGTVRLAELRNQIRYELLCGRVNEATELIYQHFPGVLPPPPEKSSNTDSKEPATPAQPANTSEYVSVTSIQPLHLLLNLRVQAFIEGCRTVPLEYPPQPKLDEDPNPKTQSSKDQPAETLTTDQQTALLKSAAKLNALIQTLPKGNKEEIQVKERLSMHVNNVIGLIAYRRPETSSLAKYMTQAHREAVADQIDRAILCHSGLPVISRIELYARKAVSAWSFLNEANIKVKPGVPMPPTSKATNTNSKGSNGDISEASGRLVFVSLLLITYLDISAAQFSRVLE